MYVLVPRGYQESKAPRERGFAHRFGGEGGPRQCQGLEQKDERRILVGKQPGNLEGLIRRVSKHPRLGHSADFGDGGPRGRTITPAVERLSKTATGNDITRVIRNGGKEASVRDVQLRQLTEINSL